LTVFKFYNLFLCVFLMVRKLSQVVMGHQHLTFVAGSVMTFFRDKGR